MKHKLPLDCTCTCAHVGECHTAPTFRKSSRAFCSGFDKDLGARRLTFTTAHTWMKANKGEHLHVERSFHSARILLVHGESRDIRIYIHTYVLIHSEDICTLQYWVVSCLWYSLFLYYHNINILNNFIIFYFRFFLYKKVIAL